MGQEPWVEYKAALLTSDVGEVGFRLHFRRYDTANIVPARWAVSALFSSSRRSTLLNPFDTQ